ncbi:hypothetical protein TCAL_14410 [Tigriopus californicus]|uniref:Uncharacterized protein n=1 Tax=Tigriopus californicus TaxID=6832 RepID=A0A553PLV0_TIGCA|nr:hypothetical protein TCAL_14410 [Tigriopus californicus]
MAQAYEQWEKDSLLILDRLSIGNMLKCHAAIGLETNYFETTAEEKDQIDFKVDRTFIVYRKGDLLPCETLSIRQNVTISNVIILGYTPLDEGLGSVFHIHEKDQIITVGDGFLGGDAFYGTNFKANFESTIDIKEQVFNAKPRDGASCDEQNRMKMSKCINEYISRSMTCQLPWTKRKQGSKRLCDKSTDWDDFRFVMDSLSENVTLNEVAVQTGCLPNCRYKKYDIEVVERNAQRIIWSPSNLTHTFLFQMKQAMVEVHEEKYFYDTNSFVDSQKRPCNETHDWIVWKEVWEHLYKDVTYEKIVKTTGCVPNCFYRKYEANMASVSIPPVIDPLVNGSHLLVLQMPQGIVTFQTEKYFYDASSFVADVGGFLGLLLGLSVMDIVEMVISVFKWITEITFKTKIDPVS